jgi:hypothetical protein
VLFVLATGGDAATRQKFVSVLTEMVQDVEEYYDQKATQFVPEPDWGIPDYIGACKANGDALPDDNLVSGALLIGIGQISNFSESKFYKKTNRTYIHASLSYASCVVKPRTKDDEGATALGPHPLADCTAVLKNQPPSTSRAAVTTTTMPKATPTPAAVLNTCQYTTTTQQPSQKLHTSTVDKMVSSWAIATPKPPPPQHTPYFITWQSDVDDDQGYARFWTPFPVLGVLLSLAGVYTLVAPSHSSGSSTVTTFPTPEPWVPPPPHGYVSSQTQMNSTTTNQASLGTFGVSFFGNGLTYDTALTATQTADQQALSAVAKIVDRFVFDQDYMGCPASALKPILKGALHPTSPVAPITNDSLCSKILNAQDPTGALIQP